MEKKFKQKGIATFEGLSIGKNRTVQVKFKLRHDEILTSVELLQGLNNDITVHAKTATSNPMSLVITPYYSVDVYSFCIVATYFCY